MMGVGLEVGGWKTIGDPSLPIQIVYIIIIIILIVYIIIIIIMIIVEERSMETRIGNSHKLMIEGWFGSPIKELTNILLRRNGSLQCQYRSLIILMRLFFPERMFLCVGVGDSSSSSEWK